MAAAGVGPFAMARKNLIVLVGLAFLSVLAALLWRPDGSTPVVDLSGVAPSPSTPNIASTSANAGEIEPVLERSAVGVEAQPAPSPTPDATPSLVEGAVEPVVEFLHYPNAGESGFRRKYNGWGEARLYTYGQELNRMLTVHAEQAADTRFQAGLHTQQFVDLTKENVSAETEPEPTGLGRVWRCTRTEPNGRFLTTFLSELEFPELWAQRDEYEWVARQWVLAQAGQQPK